MVSSIDTQQKVTNKGRKFGPDKEYVYCEIDGFPGLFTECAIRSALNRAALDPQAIAIGIPKASISIWEKIKSFLTCSWSCSE